MKVETRDHLRRLSDAAGMEYGKLVQKILAIAWLEAGARRLVERSTQGIDLEVEFGGRRIALEVKTTRDHVRFGKKDLDGLAARTEEGFEAFFAVLGPNLLDEWMLARYHGGEIKAGRDLSLTRLRPYRDADLERAIRAPFDTALRAHVDRAIAGGQSALSEVIAGYDAARVA